MALAEQQHGLSWWAIKIGVVVDLQDARAPKFDINFLPSCLPKIGVVVDLVEKIPPLAAAQANQRFKPTGTRGRRSRRRGRL